MLRASSQQARSLGRPGIVAAGHELAAAAGDQESLGQKLKHAAQDAVHRVEHAAENAVHRVTDELHERRAHAREEAERGMFTADDIREAADQVLHSRDRRGQEHEARHYQPDEEEQLLEELSSDGGHSARQKELEGLRSAVKESDGQAAEAMRRAGKEYKKDHPPH